MFSSTYQGTGSPLTHDIDTSNLVTPDISKNVSFGQFNVNEYNPLSALYSPTAPFYDPAFSVPFVPLNLSDPSVTTPAQSSQPASLPPVQRKSILKRKKSSVAAKQLPVSRSTSAGSCRSDLNDVIKVQSDDDKDDDTPTLVHKKHKSDSVPVNVLMDLIKSISSMNQSQVASQVASSVNLSNINQLGVKCTGPVRELRSAMDLSRHPTATSTKLVEVFFNLQLCCIFINLFFSFHAVRSSTLCNSTEIICSEADPLSYGIES